MGTPEGLRERRVDPRTGLTWTKIGERGSVVHIARRQGTERTTVSFATWITWERACVHCAQRREGHPHPLCEEYAA